MKRILLSLVFTCLALAATCCDICGCGAGNNYIGILPEFSKHIIGMRYRTNAMLTHVGIGGSTSYLTTSEHYRTLELWGGWNIGTRFRVISSVPYAFNERLNQGEKKSKSGPGDVSLNGYYQLMNTRAAAGSNLLVQSLWVGAGIKAPTGGYDPSAGSDIASAANLFQLGTGSLDFSVNAMYDLRLQDAGISTNASYKLNTTNNAGYRYGNKFAANAQLYYKFRLWQKLTVAPNVGASYERSQKDTDAKLAVDISGGNLVMQAVGAELNLKKVSIGANFQSPLSQQLASGIINAGNRGMVHFSFLL